jgi:hypothetical protein
VEDLDLRLREMRGKVQVPYRRKVHVVSDEAEVTSSLEMLGMLGMLDHGRSSLAMVLVLTFCRMCSSRLFSMRENDHESGLVDGHKKGGRRVNSHRYFLPCEPSPQKQVLRMWARSGGSLSIHEGIPCVW